MKSHLKHMAVGAVVVLAVLLVAGVPFERAAGWALALACPLMMVGMMLMMGRHGASGSTTGTSEHAHGATGTKEPADVTPPRRPAARW